MIAKFQKQIAVIADKVDKTSVRERLFILLVCLSVIYFTWDKAFYQNFLGTDKQRTESAKKLEDQINSIQGQISNISQAAKVDPILELTEQVKQLNQQNQVLETSIKALTKQLIPPEEMSKLLGDILNQDKEIQILRIANIPAIPLFDKGEAKAEKPEKNNKTTKEEKSLDKLQVYRHGLEINIIANYQNTTNFLERIEKLPWKILWDEINYKVTDYPNAEVHIVIYTLSLNQKWISL